MGSDLSFEAIYNNIDPLLGWSVIIVIGYHFGIKKAQFSKKNWSLEFYNNPSLYTEVPMQLLLLFFSLLLLSNPRDKKQRDKTLALVLNNNKKNSLWPKHLAFTTPSFSFSISLNLSYFLSIFKYFNCPHLLHRRMLATILKSSFILHQLHVAQHTTLSIAFFIFSSYVNNMKSVKHLCYCNNFVSYVRLCLFQYKMFYVGKCFQQIDFD